jgi:hypothetical protein
MLRKIAPLLIVFAGTVAYSGSFSGAFIFDDYVWIVNNLDIRHFDSSMLCSSRPLVGLTFYLNYLLSGLRVADYHLVNIVIHLACALLIYGILRNTFETLNVGESPGIEKSLFPFAVSVLWVVHPLTTESVTYIVQRSESLMAMFYLLTMYCFSRGVKDGSRAHRWFTAAIVSCSLGMACKPVMVTAPFVVLLYDWVFSDKAVAVIIRERRGLYAGLAASWIIPFALLSVPNESSTSAGFGAVTVSPLVYLVTQADVIFHYIKLVFLPVRLCIDYDWPAAAFSAGTLAKVIAITVLLITSLVLFLRRKAAGLAGFCFFIILFPSSGVIPLSDCAAEHRMYLPLLCVIALVLVSSGWVASRLGRVFWPAGGAFHNTMAVLLFPAVLALGFMTYERNNDYRSEETMWRRVVLSSPLNLRGHLGLGSVLLQKNSDEDAERCFSLILGDKRYQDKTFATKYATELSMAYNNLGIIKFKHGRYGDARHLFTKSLDVGYLAEAERNLRLVKEMESGRVKP